MTYHLEHTQLRVLHKYVHQERNRGPLASCRLIILEHVLPSTAEFVRQVKDAGADIFQLIAKPYSIDHATYADLEKEMPLVTKSYSELETSDYLDGVLAAAVAESRKDSKQIVILEVGGYFAAPLARMPTEFAQFIAGAIEDTTFGHNRYRDLVTDIAVPVFSVARSALKEIEARFVGRDAVSAMDHVLRRLGVAVAGRNALVIGYGMIGASVARALRSQDLTVHVYDKHDYRNLRAFIDGC